MVCHTYQLRYVTKINQGPTHLHYDWGHTQTNLLSSKFCPHRSEGVPSHASKLRKEVSSVIGSLNRCAWDVRYVVLIVQWFLHVHSWSFDFIYRRSRMFTSKKRLNGFNYYEKDMHHQEQQTNANATARSSRSHFIHGSARLCIPQSHCLSRFTSMVAPTTWSCMIVATQHPEHVYTSLADQTWTSDRACFRATQDMNAYSL